MSQRPKTAARLRETLTALDPDCEYDDWIKVGMALHYETDGREYGLAVWNEWSAKGKKYKGLGDLEFHWRSFKRDHANPRTLASRAAARDSGRACTACGAS